jgi:hypothetical protein
MSFLNGTEVFLNTAGLVVLISLASHQNERIGPYSINSPIKGKTAFFMKIMLFNSF